MRIISYNCFIRRFNESEDIITLVQSTNGCSYLFVVTSYITNFILFNKP